MLNAAGHPAGAVATPPPVRTTPDPFAALRRRELAHVAASGIAYLDYGGSALFGTSQLAAHQRALTATLFGNPHSAHRPSAASTATLAAARRQVLAFLDAPAEDPYEVCFTANASAAIKLVAESYPFGPRRGLVLSADNHNSVNGVREFARRARAPVDVIGLDDELRLRDAGAVLAARARRGGGLLALPAQSNFSGVRHPLALIEQARDVGFDTLLDAAAFLGSARLSLRRCPADFVALSFYKIFGYPTGLGALVARRAALEVLARPWFAGGTVDYVSVAHDRHRPRPLPDAFEDGTPDFLGIAALDAGFALWSEIGVERLGAHLRELTRALLAQLLALRHANGAPLIRVYGPTGGEDRGATVALNVCDADGAVVPYEGVEERARAAGVALRGGCFCNPGAAEAAFGLDRPNARRCLGELGEAFSVPAYRACLGGPAVGAIRLSLGFATTHDDLDRTVAVLATFADP